MINPFREAQVISPALNYATLSTTITSTINRGKVYGKAGDPVKVIAEHGNTLIVEDSKGQRFPVSKDKLIIEKPSAASETQEDGLTHYKVREQGITKQ